MIDLGKDLDKEHYPKQILNLFKSTIDENQNVSSFAISFNVTESYEKLRL